jgi:hypothetical protein
MKREEDCRGLSAWQCHLAVVLDLIQDTVGQSGGQAAPHYGIFPLLFNVTEQVRLGNQMRKDHAYSGDA